MRPKRARSLGSCNGCEHGWVQTINENMNMELRITLDELGESTSTEPYQENRRRERFGITSAHPRSKHKDGQAVYSIQTNAPRILRLQMHLLSIQAWALLVRDAVMLGYRFALGSWFIFLCVFLGIFIDEDVH
jgi:hypothetical protein